MAARNLADAYRPVAAAEHRLPAYVEALGAGLDATAIVGSGLFAGGVYALSSGITVDFPPLLGVTGMLAVLFVMIMRSRGLYEPRYILSIERQLRGTVTAWFGALTITLSFLFLMKASNDLSRGSVLVLAPCGLAALAGHRLAWRAGLVRAFSAGLLRRRTACVISLVPMARVSRQIRSLRFAGLDVVHRTELPADPADRETVLRGAVARMRDVEADEVVLVGEAASLEALDDVVARLRTLPIPVRFLPDESLSSLARQPTKRLGAFALIDIKREPLAAAERATKRMLDIAVAGTALVIAAPLLCVAMAAIRLEGPGPVLFRQNRRGFNGRTFRILKLRTMSVMEDGAGIVQARRHDPRVTRVGSWLRRTSIDELPQLWNVLRGEMSVVGPRPHAVAHDTLYDPIIENYAFRQHVKPGLTGWAQVNGLRGETPEVSMMAARVEHDIWYVNNWSLLLDLRILVLQATRLLARSAY